MQQRKFYNSENEQNANDGDKGVKGDEGFVTTESSCSDSSIWQLADLSESGKAR